MRKSLVYVVVVLLFGCLLAVLPAHAQEDSDQLEVRVSRLESSLRNEAKSGVAFFLFGAFCALWAQNTGRSAWAWFFLGLFFNVITVIVLLYKNSSDRAGTT